MDGGEIASMIQTIEMKKGGHIMKLKKCLAGLKAPVKKKECDAPVERPIEVKQSVLTFFKGKLPLKSDSNVPSKKPWDSFLKTNPKTEKMRFFNQVTQEIYESAFIHKQTQSKTDQQKRTLKRKESEKNAGCACRVLMLNLVSK